MAKKTKFSVIHALAALLLAILVIAVLGCSDANAETEEIPAPTHEEQLLGAYKKGFEYGFGQAMSISQNLARYCAMQQTPKPVQLEFMDGQKITFYCTSVKSRSINYHM